jgi:hypothetical protein
MIEPAANDPAAAPASGHLLNQDGSRAGPRVLGAGVRDLRRRALGYLLNQDGSRFIIQNLCR